MDHASPSEGGCRPLLSVAPLSCEIHHSLLPGRWLPSLRHSLMVWLQAAGELCGSKDTFSNASSSPLRPSLTTIDACDDRTHRHCPLQASGDAKSWGPSDQKAGAAVWHEGL